MTLITVRGSVLIGVLGGPNVLAASQSGGHTSCSNTQVPTAVAGQCRYVRLGVCPVTKQVPNQVPSAIRQPSHPLPAFRMGTSTVRICQPGPRHMSYLIKQLGFAIQYIFSSSSSSSPSHPFLIRPSSPLYHPEQQSTINSTFFYNPSP